MKADTAHAMIMLHVFVECSEVLTYQGLYTHADIVGKRGI